MSCKLGYRYRGVQIREDIVNSENTPWCLVLIVVLRVWRSLEASLSEEVFVRLRVEKEARQEDALRPEPGSKTES